VGSTGFAYTTAAAGKGPPLAPAINVHGLHILVLHPLKKEKKPAFQIAFALECQTPAAVESEDHRKRVQLFDRK